MDDYVQQRCMASQSTVMVFDEVELATLVHEEKNGPRERVVPIFAARMSWMVGRPFSILPSLPKLARSRNNRARRRLLELNNWSIRSTSIGVLRANKNSVNMSAIFGCSLRAPIIEALAIRVIVDLAAADADAILNGRPAMHLSPKNLPGLSIAITACLLCSEGL